MGLVQNGVFHGPLPQVPLFCSFGIELLDPTTEHAHGRVGIEVIPLIWIFGLWFNLIWDLGVRVIVSNMNMSLFFDIWIENAMLICFDF